ncbi:radical SAM protein [Streptomyces sp. NBC_01808]|uniref:radical SAM protein n=1 Tax=Streptomyces sp. NBC_01808 TaxID=2975947 RepID=UPI002DD9A07C|nr:radical SAM protein [Streptomyces sp. NBC_01808]WSA37879.1 radical SAM protein [Streptomyces sp. NBC_01808]
MSPRRTLPLVPVQGTGSIAPSPAVVERLHSLPLQTVDNISAAFPGIPVEEIRTASHFQNIRLLSTATCAMRCGYPGDDTVWCHNEGMIRNGLRDADLDALRATVAGIRRERGITQVTLAGLEPRLSDDFVRFIAHLRADGIAKISLVSHGLKLLDWLERLKDAGLSDIVLSVQAFEREAYADIMGHDAFPNALKVIDLAVAIGMPVAINRVLLRGFHDDIPGFLDWIDRRRLRVRLYDVMWMPRQDDQWLRNHISWQEITHLWSGRTERITVWTYGLPGRVNMVWWLRGGASIETNLNYPRTQHTAPVCQNCRVKDACLEGWMGCGIRITPDLKATGCVLRPDLALPLTTSDGRYVEASRLDEYVAGTDHRNSWESPCCSTANASFFPASSPTTPSPSPSPARPWNTARRSS